MNQTGTVNMHQGNAPTPSFPKQYRRGIASRFERTFLIIFGSLIFLAYTTIGLMSVFIKEPAEPSQQEILKIQERYAQLVLNQPKPKEEVKVEEKSKPGVNEEAAEKKVEEKAEEKVNREKESFVEKEQRKEAGSEVRRQIREQVSKQIQSTGIFAAITAAGNSGGSSGISSDLLGGATEGTADLSSISISKGSFVAKNSDDAASLTSKKGSVSGVGIEKQAIARTEVAQVASTGAVNITSQAPEVTGESASHADRSQSAIARVVNRETQRLKRVYEDWLKRDPSLSGSLTIKFVILPSGAVSNVSVVKSSTNNSEFDETILRYIKRWQFPAVPDSGPVEVVYPFVFEGQS